MGFTEKQLKDWQVYEEVRSTGRFNMFDPRARCLTGLSRDEYMFVLEHYSELKDAQEGSAS